MPPKYETSLLKTVWQYTVSLLRQWWLPLLFVWTFLFAGVATLGYGIYSSLEAWYSRSWPAVDGRINLSQMTSYQSESDSGTTTMYHADVNFLYTVEGKQYYSDKVNLGDYSTSDPHDAEKIIARYPNGSAVQVYYDPGKPENAVLEPGPTLGLLIPLIIGVIFSLLGSGMTYALMHKILGKERKKREQSP